MVPLSLLPDVSRVWVIGSAEPLGPPDEQMLLRSVDEYLAGWAAHGVPLTVGRDWSEHRFLTIAVDPTASDASGCSLDALFRTFKGLEQRLGTRLLDRGLVFYRDGSGVVRSTGRGEFAELARAGVVTGETTVFDTSVQTLGEWRDHFSTAARCAWHQALLPRGTAEPGGAPVAR